MAFLFVSKRQVKVRGKNGAKVVKCEVQISHDDEGSMMYCCGSGQAIHVGKECGGVFEGESLSN